jgi:DNA-binding NarL/FixJ family response regulator
VTARGVLVAHREPLVAEALASALGRYPHLVPVGITSTSEATNLPSRRIDAAVVDSQMAGFAGLARTLRRRGARVIFFGPSSDDDQSVYVSASASVAALAAALTPGFPLTAPGSALPISQREQEILSLAARGLAAKQIAGQLGISSKTVEAHKSRAFRKLGVPNQAAAVSLVTAANDARRAPVTALIGRVVG